MICIDLHRALMIYVLIKTVLWHMHIMILWDTIQDKLMVLSLRTFLFKVMVLPHSKSCILSVTSITYAKSDLNEQPLYKKLQIHKK